VYAAAGLRPCPLRLGLAALEASAGASASGAGVSSSAAGMEWSLSCETSDGVLGEVSAVAVGAAAPFCFDPTTWLVFSVLGPKSMRRKRWIDAPFASSSRVRKARVSMAALSLSTSASPSGPALARARMASSSRSSISVTLLGWPREPAAPGFLRCWRSSLRRADVTLTSGSGCSQSTR
jgi:hypothetical protein